MGIRRLDTPEDDESRERKLEEWDNKINETHIHPYVIYGLAFVITFSVTFLLASWIYLRYF